MEVPAKQVSGFGQFKALFKKNWILQRRTKKQFVLEIFLQILVPGILSILKAMTKMDAQPSIPFINPRSLDNNTLQYANNFINKRILVSPDTAEIRNIGNETAMILQQMLQLPKPPGLVYYTDRDFMGTAYQEEKFNIIAGIEFDYKKTQFDYVIRTPNDETPDTSTFIRKQDQCRSGNDEDTSNCDANKYLSSGFCLIQTAVDTAFIRILTSNNSFPRPEISVQMMPKPSYTPDSRTFQIISAICFGMAYSYLAPCLIANLVAEKEKKIWKNMQMMGMYDSVFWLSWGLTHMILVSVSAAIVTIFMVATSLFANSNVFILFLIMCLYGLSIITVAYALIRVLFRFLSRPSLASLFLFFVASMVTIFSVSTYIGLSKVNRTSGGPEFNKFPIVSWFICFIPPLAAAFTFEQAMFLDKPANGGIYFNTIAAGDFPLGAPMVMLLIDAVLCFLIAVYLDDVIPVMCMEEKHGTRQKPWFFFMPSYWCTKKKMDQRLSPEVTQRQEHVTFVESVPNELEEKTAVRLSDIHKEFKSKETKKMVPAVDGLSLDIYEGQITCLLGHNGAGKTTLFNMLTGLIPPTKGTASVLGMNITNQQDMKRLRTMTGVCSQENILFDNLTCKEHLHLYGAIKGVPDPLLQSEAEKALEDVVLYNERDTLAKKLSDGQKRKLCVAIALIGDPKIIFLDEPTAGMDLSSRHHLWSVLKRKKEDRVILLITHLMDEADILADRKAIISKGKLRCCGSSLYLKTKFGIGYHLNINIYRDCDVDQVTQLVKNCVPGGELHKTQEMELTYTLPLNELHNFPDLFSAIEKTIAPCNTAALEGIKSYGVSLTSLEEVFFKLEEDDSSNKSGGSPQDLSRSSYTDSLTMDILSSSRLDRSKLKSQQFRALCKLRFLLMLRHLKLTLSVLTLPASLVLVALVVIVCSQGSGKDTTLEPLYVENAISQYARRTTGSAAIPPMALNDSVSAGDSAVFLDLISSDFVTDNFDNASDLLSSYHMLGIQLDKYTLTESVVTIGYTAVYNDSAIHSIPAAINVMTNTLLMALNHNISLSAANFPWSKGSTRTTLHKVFIWLCTSLPLMVLILPPFLATVHVRDRQFKIRSQLRVTGVTSFMYWTTTLITDLLQLLMPVSILYLPLIVISFVNPVYAGVGLVTSILLAFSMPSNTLFIYILLVRCIDTQGAIVKAGTIVIFVGHLCYGLVYSLNLIAGAKSVTSLLHYIFLAIVPPYANMGCFYFIRRAIYKNEESPENLFSDCFSQQIVMSFVMPAIHCFLGIILLRILELRNTAGDVWDTFPCSSRKRNSQGITQKNDGSLKNEDEDEDVRNERCRVHSIKSNKRNVPIYVEDLSKEYTRNEDDISNGGKGVHNTTFAVNTGEIFGLLGPNGAGKSTTLKMMIGELSCTQGQVVLGGHDIRSCMSRALDDVGFCPSHDALWDDITLKEHIEIYAEIRGVSKKDISILSEYFIKNMKLDEHKNKKCKKLSGGTKRKLSFILGILSRPKLLILDEPSTGMDPQSKRLVRDTINSCLKGSERSAIITTHKMEEAESLCDIVAFLVNGRIRCLGEIERLKEKYALGYRLEMKLELSGCIMELGTRMESLQEEIKDLFPETTYKEKFAERLTYTIPKRCVKSLATTFTALEQAKAKYSLDEYSFSQCTLEQVYLQFAKEQIDEDLPVEP